MSGREKKTLKKVKEEEGEKREERNLINCPEHFTPRERGRKRRMEEEKKVFLSSSLTGGRTRSGNERVSE